MRTVRLLAAAWTLAAMGLLAVPATAVASAGAMGAHVSAVTSNSFVVATAPLGAGWRYRLIYSTSRAQLSAANLSSTQRSATASKPVIRAQSSYTIARYWYRVEAVHGSEHRYSGILGTWLRPPRPSVVSVSSGAVKFPFLAWTSPAAASFDIETARDARFTSGVRRYAVRGDTRSFTLYAVPRGAVEFARVRADNHGVTSAYSRTVSFSNGAQATPLRVMTYNVLLNAADGKRIGDQTVAPWSNARRDAAAALIRSARPDIIAIQEGGGWVGQPGQRLRQVQDLAGVLGGDYTLVQGAAGTGDAIIYRNSRLHQQGDVVSPVPVSGTSSVAARYAVYAQFKITGGGAFWFAATHLATGTGTAADTERENETRALLAVMNNPAFMMPPLPVIYAGDFNSHRGAGHTFDGPGLVMQAHYIPDALSVTATASNAQYNSANRYLRTPPAGGGDIDHVYVPPGVGVTSWRMLLHLHRGAFAGIIPSDHNPIVVDLAVPRWP